MRRLIALAAAVVALAALVAGGRAPLADTLAEIRAGNAAFGEGRHEAAVEAYTRAILAGDLDPDALAVTFNNRGVAYSELGDYDRAVQDYNQALGLKPGDKTAVKNLRIGHTRRAGASANLGEYEAALSDYAKAVELDPRHAPTYLRRGQLHLERGDLRAAIADLAKAKELDPAGREQAELLAKAEADLAATTRTATAGVAQPAASPPGTQPPPPPGEAQQQQPAGQSPPDGEPTAITQAEPSAGQASAAPTRGDATPPQGPDAVVAAQQTAPQRPPVRIEEGPERMFRVLQTVRMRDGPGNDYPQVGSLAADTVVAVVGESRSWMYVRLRSGKRGFVYQRFLEPVPAE
jgi:Flp pilus assembly protein TadD